MCVLHIHPFFVPIDIQHIKHPHRVFTVDVPIQALWSQTQRDNVVPRPGVGALQIHADDQKTKAQNTTRHTPYPVCSIQNDKKNKAGKHHDTRPILCDTYLAKRGRSATSLRAAHVVRRLPEPVTSMTSPLVLREKKNGLKRQIKTKRTKTKRIEDKTIANQTRRVGGRPSIMYLL